ncbi:MAG TPA: Gfo/Idh/MocA family oxidoreductase [Nocardioidaceae bacterium]|nr:Gfo/Idh/MocA family oxidoreductase [Nocardioidaceae bacterium]
MSQRPSLRVGVIGCGMIGSDHVRTLTTGVSGAEVVAVSDADPQRAAQAAELTDGAARQPDPFAVINDERIDAVLIASSEDTHEQFVLACVEAGKPVLCEKPLAPTPAACLRVVEAEVARGRQLVQVGFMRRFDPSYREMKRLLDSGQLGAPLVLHCVHRNAEYPPFYDSSALVTATGVHDIDIARWLLGQEIVAATVHNPRPSSLVREGFQDPQFLVLHTDGGAVVDVEIFVNARYGYDVRAELVGERGTASLMPPATATVRLDGMDGQPVLADSRPRFAPAFRNELQAWADAAVHGRAVGANAWDGYAAAAVAETCLTAATTRTTTPVRLADKPALYTDDSKEAR